MDSKPVYSLDNVETQLQTSWGVGFTYYEFWPLGTVTYAIASDTPVEGDDGWETMTPDQVAAAQEAFDIWDELMGNLQLVAVSDPSQADITFSYSANVAANASGVTPTQIGPEIDVTDPAHKIEHAAVQISPSQASNADGAFTLNSFGFTTFLHEIGHSLGLSHPDTYNASDKTAPTYESNATFAQDSVQYTIMSYFGSEFAKGWNVDNNGGYDPSTPMLDDIATIQSKYGANWNTRDTNTIYGYGSNAGWAFFDFTLDTHPVFTIWDGGGDDSIDASRYAGNQTISLLPGTYSSVLGYVDNIAIAYAETNGADQTDTDLIENAYGGGGNDVIIGNDAENKLEGNDGFDTITGGGGADTLIGDGGADVLDGSGVGADIFATEYLTGGTGTDTFVYGTGYGTTTITDFTITSDSLDLTKTAVHDWATLLGLAKADGNDTVIDFRKNTIGLDDALRLQGITLDQFTNMDPSAVIFSPDTTPVSGGFDILPNPTDNLATEYAYVAPLAGGGFAALRLSVAESATDTLYVYRYDAHGVLIDRVQVNTVPWDGSSMSMIGLSSGRIIVVWDTSTGGSNGSAAIRGRVLDANGNPIGDDFLVSTTESVPFAGEGTIGRDNLRVSLTASSGGGAVLTWSEDTSANVPIDQKLHIWRNGIYPDGSVAGEDRDLGVAGGGVGYTGVFAIPGVLSYWLTQSSSGNPYPIWHAYYELAGSGVAVQLDNNDIIPDEGGTDSPAFNAIQLTDGRVLFQYSSGYTFGYSENVTAEKILILDPVTGGFTKPGTDGDDFLKGGSGNDELSGLGGNDTLQGNGGADLLDGGPGIDTADYALSLKPVTIDLRLTGAQAGDGDGDGAGDTLVSIENLTGSAYDDLLRGDAGANVIDGSYGNDTIEGNGGADTLLGGSGADLITLLADTIDGSIPQAHGGAGDDKITVDGTGGVIYGDAGDDRLVIGGDSDSAYGGDDNDTLLVTGGGDNLLDGGDGADNLTGGAGNDTLYGGAGDDIYGASGGDDVIDDVSGTADTLVYKSALDAFSVRYDPTSGGFKITDTSDGSPEGSTTLTADQLYADAAALGTSGTVEDGYIVGATVFADTNFDGVPDDGEASGTTDSTGHFTVADAGDVLFSTGGTDTATRLPQTLPLAAPAGSQMLTPLTTLLLGLDGVASVPHVLAVFGIGGSYDLLASDPIAGVKAGDADAVRAFVVGTEVMDTLAAGTAFLGPVFGVDAASSFWTMLNQGLALVFNDVDTVDLTDPAIIRAALVNATYGSTIDDGVLDKASAAIADMNAAADARAALTGDALLVADSAVARTAQAGLVTALFDAGQDATKLDTVLAQYSGTALDDKITANVSQLGVVDSPACYCAGTGILTDRGEIAVEDLRVGDLVQTHLSGMMPIKWLGRRRVHCARHPYPERVWPIRVRAHAFEKGRPHRDLWLSPDHAVFVDGNFIPIRCLLNGTTIRQISMATATYHHVELACHSVLLAQGLPAESYLDTGNRAAFENAGTPMLLHPAFSRADQDGRSAAPWKVESVWHRIAARAAALGMPVSTPQVTTQSSLRLIEILPLETSDNRRAFVLPPRARTVRIVSRATAPSDLRPWLDDRRKLGVPVSRIVLRDRTSVIDMPVDHPSLQDGWHDLERDDTRLWRWTDGDATMPLAVGTRMMEVHLRGPTEYLVLPDNMQRVSAAGLKPDTDRAWY